MGFQRNIVCEYGKMCGASYGRIRQAPCQVSGRERKVRGPHRKQPSQRNHRRSLYHLGALNKFILLSGNEFSHE